MSKGGQERTARSVGCPSANFAARWNWCVEDFPSCLRQDFTQFLRSLAKFLRLRADPSVAVRQHNSITPLLGWARGRVSRIDAEMLLAHLLEVEKAELYIYEDEIGQEVVDKFNLLVNRRAAGEPLQYILGKAEFMGLEFIVTPDVLIPRPETELLVEEVIKPIMDRRDILVPPIGGVGKPRLSKPIPPRNDVRILDLGTGSGNIAISLTKFISDCKIIASDVSETALAVARQNAQQLLPLTLHSPRIDGTFLSRKRRGWKTPPIQNGERDGVRGNIRFVLSDLLNELNGYEFDIIVSNPPYVARPEFEGLQREVALEPRIALDGGMDGLDFYRRIIREAPVFLSDGGRLFLEIGFGQADRVKALFEKYRYKNILFIEDYNAIKRVAIGQWIN